MLSNTYQRSGGSLLKLSSRAGYETSLARASRCTARTVRVAASTIPSRRIEGAATAADVISTETDILQEKQPTAAITKAPVPSNSTPAPAVDKAVNSFAWLSHWYPVHVLDELDSSRPHAVELLGKQLVLWRDAQGTWQCFDDACPHRLAPLSEGRLDIDGTLMCSYHGWKFAGNGACVDIPQAISEKSKAVACNCNKSRAVAYPTRQAYGLVWVWPTSGAAAEAVAGVTPLPITPAVKEFWDSGNQVKWFRRELEYSYDILVENLVDPAHVPWAHHNLNPNTTRSKGGAMMIKPTKLEVSNPVQANTGIASGIGAKNGAGNGAADIEGNHEPAGARPLYMHAHSDPFCAFEYGTALAPSGAHMSFTPPCSSACQYTLGAGRLCRSELMAVPMRPGKSVAITMLEMTDMTKVTAAEVCKSLFTEPNRFPALVQRYMKEHRPLYEEHLQANTLFDQDMVFLHEADRLLSLRGRFSWPRSYYMPTPSDAAVIAARRWFNKSLNLPLNPSDATSPPASSVICPTPESAAAAVSDRRRTMDRYNQHTKHCVICKTAMRQLEQQLSLLKVASMVLGASAVGLIAADAVLLFDAVINSGYNSCDASKDLTCLAEQTVQAITGNGVVMATGGVGMWLGVAAVLCAAWGKAVQDKLQKFSYVEFYHADNN